MTNESDLESMENNVFDINSYSISPPLQWIFGLKAQSANALTVTCDSILYTLESANLSTVHNACLELLNENKNIM